MFLVLFRQFNSGEFGEFHNDQPGSIVAFTINQKVAAEAVVR
jgi:hypothetical protein